MEQPVFLNATQMSEPAEGIDAVGLGATILPENPFVGLRPFESKEAVLFFGRRDQTKQLLSILHASRFVAVVGSSGCGKSSLIRAGLIPNLQAGFVAGSVDRWNIITMKPGNSPLQNLATGLLSSFEENPQPAAVDALVDDIRLFGVSAVTSFLNEQTEGVKTNFLLLVDQFEEIFRFAAYEDNDDAQQNKLNEQIRETRREEAADLVSIMLDLVIQETIPVYVVMTMRSDFLGECDAFYGLPEAMNKSQYLVPRLTRQQRQQAIENPVLFYGAAISDRLTDRVLNDMEEERDQLPIMQHALMRTWEKWQTGKVGPLDLSHYVEAGTVAEALSRDADDAMKGLSQDEHIIAERMFQALTTTDAKGRRLRRPTHLSELAAITGSKEVVLKLIDRFRNNNRCFLMLSADRDPLVDISHESLIRQWGTLRQWVDEEVTSREMYLRLANDAVRHKAKEAPLWSDPALQLALNWWSKRQPTEAWGRRYHKEFKLTEDFLNQSEKKRNDDALAAQRLQAAKIRRTRVFALMMMIFSVLVSGTAVWALKNQREANEARTSLEAQQVELQRNRDALVMANASLRTEKEEADKARNDAEKAKNDAVTASEEAKKQEDIAKTQKAKVVLALKKADQTAAADNLRRKAANEQNAGETEYAQSSYLRAVEAYNKIDNTEGAAFAYFELGNMLVSSDDDTEIDVQGRSFNHERWDRLVKPNWVDRVLLDTTLNEAYLKSIGLTKAQANGLDYYAKAIKAYRQSGGDSGFNGVAAVLEKVGDLISDDDSLGTGDDEDPKYVPRQRDIAMHDSFCMALKNYQRADNPKRQISLLNKIGERLEKTPGDSPDEDDNDETTGAAAGHSPGCNGLGNVSTTYFEESLKLYPALLKKYSHKSNQFKEAQQAYADLLLKVGKMYYGSSKAGDGTDQKLAFDRFNKAAEIFRADGDVEQTVNTYAEIADNFEEDELKSKYYELGAAEYHRLSRFEEEAGFLADVGRTYASRARSTRTTVSNRKEYNEKALSYLNRSLSIYQQHNNQKKSSSIYASIAGIYNGLAKYDEALTAYQTALSISLKIDDKESLPRDYYNLGRFLELRGKKDEAKKAYEEVIRLTPNDGPNLLRRGAESGLKRLRGESPPLKPSPTPKPSPSPGVSGFLWFGTLLRMLLV